MNKEQLEDDKAYIRLFNQNTKLSKRVKEYESLHKKLVKQVCEAKDERAKLRIENKRYREHFNWIIKNSTDKYAVQASYEAMEGEE